MNESNAVLIVACKSQVGGDNAGNVVAKNLRAVIFCNVQRDAVVIHDGLGESWP